MLVLCVTVYIDEGPYVTRQTPPPALDISSIQASSVSGLVSIVKTVLHCLRENDSNFSMVLSAFSPNLHTTNLPPWASACSCLGYRTVAMVAESGGYEFNG